MRKGDLDRARIQTEDLGFGGCSANSNGDTGGGEQSFAQKGFLFQLKTIFDCIAWIPWVTVVRGLQLFFLLTAMTSA